MPIELNHTIVHASASPWRANIGVLHLPRTPNRMPQSRLTFTDFPFTFPAFSLRIASPAMPRATAT